MHKAETSLLKLPRSTWKRCFTLCVYCSLCSVAVFSLVTYFVLFHVHQFTCGIAGDTLCMPLYRLIEGIPHIPNGVADISSRMLVVNRSATVDRNYQLAYEQCLAKDYNNNLAVANPCVGESQNRVEVGILLGQQHGGTNMLRDTLNLHNDVYVSRELLFINPDSFWHSHCSLSSQWLEPSKKCTWKVYKKGLDEVFSTNAPRHCTSGSEKEVWLWKLQLEQIYPEFYGRFADYLFCNNVTVLHLVRQSSVAAFWSRLAATKEAFDSRLKGVDEKDVRTQRMSLEPKRTVEVVQRMDDNKRALSEAIRMQPFGVKYMQVFYEDLINAKHGSDLWKAVQAFLGVSQELVASNGQIATSRSVRERRHASGCSVKIQNWAEIKPLLNDSLSAKACEKLFS